MNDLSFDYVLLCFIRNLRVLGEGVDPTLHWGATRLFVARRRCYLYSCRLYTCTSERLDSNRRTAECPYLVTQREIINSHSEVCTLVFWIIKYHFLVCKSALRFLSKRFLPLQGFVKVEEVKQTTSVLEEIILSSFNFGVADYKLSQQRPDKPVIQTVC